MHCHTIVKYVLNIIQEKRTEPECSVSTVPGSLIMIYRLGCRSHIEVCTFKFKTCISFSMYLLS